MTAADLDCSSASGVLISLSSGAVVALVGLAIAWVRRRR